MEMPPIEGKLHATRFNQRTCDRWSIFHSVLHTCPFDEASRQQVSNNCRRQRREQIDAHKEDLQREHITCVGCLLLFSMTSQLALIDLVTISQSSFLTGSLTNHQNLSELQYGSLPITEAHRVLCNELGFLS
jgi:hypothetical protein